MNNNLPQKDKILNNSIQISSISTGFIEIPGQISLNLYVQGCKMACKGCQNPDLQSFSGGTTINSSDIPNILKNRDLPTWICWLGGDAVYQPEGFMEFNKIFKEKGYKICLYTGKYFNEIENLLENVDLVIDGPWEGKKIDEDNTNQKIYVKQNGKWYNIEYDKLKNMKGK